MHVYLDQSGDLEAHRLAELIAQANDAGHATLELSCPMTGDPAADRTQEAHLRAIGGTVQLKYVEMHCRLTTSTTTAPPLPEGLAVRPVQAGNAEALYACYHAAFSAGEAHFFAAQDEAERRAYFDSLYAMPDMLGDAASLALWHTQGHAQQLAGFSFVLPDGPPDNRHISCMCVHPDQQGRGLGKLLLRLVMAHVWAAGGTTITLGTEPQMRAFSLYRAHGFTVTGGSTLYTFPV